MKIKFDNNFWWGAATSGPQSEGSFNKNNLNIMEQWFSETPGDFHNYVGPYTATDVYHKFKKDIELMKELKINSFRTSIQWTRLIKNLETNEIDEDGYRFYKTYFSLLKKNNIKVVVNLFHFDMPKVFQDIGGFENKEVINKYAQYARIAFKLFGDDVDYWATFNEPVVPVEACYLYQWYYPKIISFKRAIQAGYGTILAHAKAVNIFHEMFKDNKDKKISIILNLTPTYPRDVNNHEDVKAAEIRDTLFNKAFLNPVVNGSFPELLINLLKEEDLLPEYSSLELEEIKKSRIDFLGVNYYQPARVCARSAPYNLEYKMPEMWFENYDWKEKRINPYRGWEIHPQTIYNIATLIKDNYDNIPWFISENGMGVENESRFRNEQGYIDDDYRIEFLKEHLYWLNKAINEGCNCFGFHNWTFIDCWSWANSYKNRYGFIELDLITQKRIIKKSGYWLKSIIENNNEIEIEDELINDGQD